MTNRVPIHNPFSQEIDEVKDAVDLFNYAKNLKKQIMKYEGKGNDIEGDSLHTEFRDFLLKSGSGETFQSQFSSFLASKVISDKYKKDFVVDIALKQHGFILDFMEFDKDELLNTKEKDTALSAGKYLIKESNGEQPILICYMKRFEREEEEGKDIMNEFLLDSKLLHYSYAKAIAETGKKAVKDEFAKYFEENFDSLFLSNIEKYRKKIREEKYFPQKSTKEELEAKIQFMNELRKKPDNAEYLALYLCNKEENDNQKSLLAKIVDFGINNLGSLERGILTGILNTVYTENGQTLLDYYSEKSTDSNEIKAKTLTYLQAKKELEKKLEEKFLTLKEIIPDSLDNQKVFVSYLCDKKENDNQKSLLAEIAGFGIDKLETRNQVYLKELLSNTRYTEDGQMTLLDDYSENSTDSKEIKAETLFYLREFQKVDRYYSPKDTEKKLYDKFMFMRKTMKDHPAMKDHPGQIGCLVPYLCDKKQNGGQKSLLAEIVGFGINNLKPSDQDTLKEILNTVRTKNGKTLLDDYSKNSTDSEEIKAETSFYLRDFQYVTQYYDPEDTKSKLAKKIRFMNELRKKPDNAEYLALCLCSKKQNGGQKSLLAEIVDFEINNLGSSERGILTGIPNAVYTKNGQTTLLDYYNQNSTDSEKTRIETSTYLQKLIKLEGKFLTLKEFIPNSLDDQKDLVSYLCDIGKNGGQKSLLAEIVDVGINNLGSSEQDTLREILNEKYTIGGCEQTLLDYYSKNSKDSEKTRTKTLFYLREFQKVDRYYSPKDTL